MSDNRYLTTRQVAAVLGVSLGTVQQMVESGALQAWKTAGGHRRILATSVDSYVARTHPHDFGTYREVSIRYDEHDGAAVDFAYQVELSVPDEWDPIAQYELAWYERKNVYTAAVRDKRLQPEEVPTHFGTVKPPSLPPGSRFSELLTAFPL